MTKIGARRIAKVGMIPRVGEVMIKTGATRTTEAGAGTIAGVGTRMMMARKAGAMTKIGARRIAKVGTITKDGRVGMMAKILLHLHRQRQRVRHRRRVS